MKQGFKNSFNKKSRPGGSTVELLTMPSEMNNEQG
jgi:hypothetical protein